MQAPGAVEEEALVVGEGRTVLSEHVNKRGDVRPVRMGAFGGLLELLGIAKQYDISRGARGSKCVR